MFAKELVKQLLRDIALVAKQFAKEFTGKCGYRLAVIDIASRQAKGEQFATIIDHQMQFEAIKPAQRGLATLRDAFKHTVAVNPLVVADRQRSCIDKAQ